MIDEIGSNVKNDAKAESSHENRLVQMLQEADREQINHLKKIFIDEDLNKLKLANSLEKKTSNSKNFVNKHFDKDVFPRLNTFEKFAFSSVEKDDHPFLIPSLKDLKSTKEPLGTMLITDLWTKKLQRDCLNKSKMLNEKNKMEKFLYYTSKNITKKEESSSVPVLKGVMTGSSKTEISTTKGAIFLDRKNEILLKNKIIMNELRQDHESNVANQNYMGLLNFGQFKQE
jgi:hypothetical protein